MDIYKLFDRNELKKLSVGEIKERTDGAILFDAYREQEGLLSKYSNNDNIEGLEKVLYACPNCGKEFTVKVIDFIPWRDDCGTYRNNSPCSGNFSNGLASSDLSRSNWCPGTVTNPEYIYLGDLEAGDHTITVDIPHEDAMHIGRAHV